MVERRYPELSGCLFSFLKKQKQNFLLEKTTNSRKKQNIIYPIFVFLHLFFKIYNIHFIKLCNYLK